ncbi:hypothetical protein FQZ97_1107980 [compost metagenome]
MLEQVHDQRHEQIGGFAGLVLARKVVLDTVFFHATKGRIGEDDVYTVLRAVVLERAAQGVVVPDIAGYIDAVQHQVGQGQHVG